jgi:hypothetical protein
VICFAEKNGRHGGDIARWVGFGLLGLGLAVLVHPPFLTV